MNNIIKIILSILAALTLFLAGWFSHAWKNRDQVSTEVKKAIEALNQEHKKALEAIKRDYKDKLEDKNDIINNLNLIINRLIKVFDTIEGAAAVRVVKNLKQNQEKLHRL